MKTIEEQIQDLANEFNLDFSKAKALLTNTTPDGEIRILKMNVANMRFMLKNGGYFCPPYDYSTRIIWDDVIGRKCGYGNYEEILGVFFPLATISLDHKLGRCEDNNGVPEMFRYLRGEDVYMKKIGKLFIEQAKEVFPSEEDWKIAEPVAKRVAVLLSAKWAADNDYSGYELVVDKDFKKIYSFGEGSCMRGRDKYPFYDNSVNAKAARLVRNGENVARCVIFQDVWDNEKNHYRFRERIYGSEKDKRVMHEMIKKEGLADLYKSIDASPHDGRDIYRYSNNSHLESPLYTKVSLIYGEPISWQDSFKYYNHNSGVASNDSRFESTYELTESFFEQQEEYVTCADCGETIRMEDANFYGYDLFCNDCFVHTADGYDIPRRNAIYANVDNGFAYFCSTEEIFVDPDGDYWYNGDYVQCEIDHYAYESRNATEVEYRYGTFMINNYDLSDYILRGEIVKNGDGQAFLVKEICDYDGHELAPCLVEYLIDNGCDVEKSTDNARAAVE